MNNELRNYLLEYWQMTKENHLKYQENISRLGSALTIFKIQNKHKLGNLSRGGRCQGGFDLNGQFKSQFKSFK